MTVSSPSETETPSETVLDAMIRAGASTGLGWEDLYVQFTAAGFKLDRDHVRSIVIPKITTAPRGASGGRNAAG